MKRSLPFDVAVLLMGVGCGAGPSSTTTVTPHSATEDPRQAIAAQHEGPLTTPTTSPLGPQTQPAVRWRVTTQDRVIATPIELKDGSIAIGSLDGSLYRLGRDGTLIQTTPTGAPIRARALAIGRSDVVVANGAGDVIRIDSQGIVMWRSSLHSLIAADLIGGDDRRIYVSADGVYALDTAGNVHWHHVEATTIYSTPALSKSGDVVYATVDGRVVALDSAGSVRWTTRVTAAVTSPVAMVDARIVVITELNQRHTLSDGGAVLSTEEIEATPMRTAVDREGNRYFANSDQNVLGTRRDGTILWSYNLGANVAGSVLLTSSGTLVAGADDGNIYALH